MRAKGPRYKKASVVGDENREHDVGRTEEKAKRTPCGEQEEEEHHSNDDARGL